MYTLGRINLQMARGYAAKKPCQHKCSAPEAPPDIADSLQPWRLLINFDSAGLEIDQLERI